MNPMHWINVNKKPPKTDPKTGQSKNYLVYIDNPYWVNDNYHIAWLEKTDWGNLWHGIEINVHRSDSRANVTHYMELPPPPPKDNK